MAGMSAVQQNVVSEIQSLAADEIRIQSRLTAIAAMYTNEGLASLVDADFALYAPFVQITASEFQAACGALAAINAAINAGTPSNWSKLLKICEGVPK